MDTLYILTRSSGRAEFFRRCRESVKALTYPGPVVHIVHTDDPRDRYVEGDIIVRGEALVLEKHGFGRVTYRGVTVC